MNKIQLLYILLIIFPLFSQAQSIDKKFVWNDLQTIYMGEDIKCYFLSFEGSQTDYRSGMLPVSLDRIAVKSSNDRLILKLSDVVFETLPDELVNLLDDKYLIRDKFLLFTENSLLDKKPVADIALIPIRYNAENDNYERLLSCTIEYEIVEIQATTNRDLSKDFSYTSILSSGKWYRIATVNSGIHKISYSELKSMGLDIDDIDPRNIRLYGNGNGMVPESNGEERPDDLIENAIQIVGEEDGSFDASDYILFYGQGPVKWTYNYFTGFFVHENNYYTDEVNYFITADLGPGKRIINDAPLSEDATHFIKEFIDYQVHDVDEINILKSGKIWFGEEYKVQLSYDYQFNFKDIVIGKDALLRTNIAARSLQTSIFDFSYNGSVFLSVPINKVSINSTIYAWSLTPEIVEITPVSDDITINVTYNPSSTIAVGWMNFIEINAFRNLNMNGSQLAFRDIENSGAGNIAEYHITNANNDLIVWDISDKYNIHKKSGNYTGSDFVFKAHHDDMVEYIAFDGTSFHSITFIEEVENQNLHAHNTVNFVIITHPDFYDQAVRIGDIHQQHDRLSYSVVTLQQIYNEFSSGVQDISAIRDYCRMLYLRGDSTNMLRYVLLFGDGSYDPKCRHIDNCNYMPTFQSKESLKHGYSFVTDDFFGLFDSDEGNNAYGKTIDVGVGRMPASNIEQATQLVDKIDHYLSSDKKVHGNWRNKVCFIADDEDNNIHFKQAERLVTLIDTSYEDFLIDKIYMDAFIQVNTAAGHRYPDVVKAINNAMSEGALIINYTGHGGETGLAHEKICDIPTINSWKNFDNMPLFITATCEFSRFDEPAFTSAGELVMLNPDGGGVSIFTTTRLAWSDPNFKLNKILYENCFERINGEYPHLGDLVKIAKTEMYISQNVKNFVLLGDPALKLRYPEHLIKTSAIEIKDIAASGDTLQALSEVTVSGYVVDVYGVNQNNFNGYVIPTIYDKKTQYKTLGNDPGSQVANFNLCDKILYKGKATVNNGTFSFTFLMPKNINFNYGLGRISYYAYDTISFEDAHGKEDIVVGGIDNTVPVDYTGPQMDVFLNNTSFTSGDYVTPDPLLMVRLYDEQGIDAFNNTLGHEITAILDEAYREPMKLNNFYEPDADTYKSGWVLYPMDSISDGFHTLSIRSWDIHNNPSEKEISFYINKKGELTINEVQNIPNPFRDQTTFVFHHNKPEDTFELEISIYNISGQEVARLKQTVQSQGQNLESVRWDGTSANGGKLSRGIYPYRIRIWDQAGYYKEYSQKLIISR